ncbi:MAG: glycosyltransferase family 4 protein [Chloroflexota bacterium]|nr:glycosyltransferase family 4 protein [Chloroflexota bacterium]
MSPAALRIGLVYDALYPYVTGGAEKRYHELARRLAERHEVHYLTWRHWDGPNEIVRDGITLHGVGRPPALYGADGKRTVREAVAFSARLLPVLLRQRWDVIDCSATPYLPLYAAWLGARVTRTPLVATWHEFWGEHWHDYLPRRPIVARVARALEWGSRRLGDVTVPVSEFTAHRMGLPAAEEATIVGNGVDLDAIRATRRASKPVEVVFVGRLIDEKRVDLLLEAIHALAGRFPNLRCMVIGEGPERAALEGRAVRLGLAERVTFTGRIEGSRVYAAVKAAAVLVMPSVREGFGITVAEAQACGTVPIVVRSPMSAASALVRDGVDGLTCDPTIASMAEALARLLSDPVRLAAMSRAARRAAQQYDWDLLADRMEQVYLQAAHHRMALAAAT